MKTTNRYFYVWIGIVAIAILMLLVLGVAAPAFSTSALTPLLAPASSPTSLPGDAIPIKPITSLSSLNARVKLDVNGQINGKRAKGELNGLVAMNDQKKSRVTVSGSLLGDVAAQVGGSVVGLFTPSKVDVYKVPEGAYVVVNGLIPICIKPNAPKATAALDDLSPQSLLTMLTSSDVARGELVGEETLNGVPVKHYVINGDAFLAAAQASTDPQLRAFGEALWSANDADLYLDAQGGYPVAFRGSYSGAFAPLKFEGDFGVQIDLTDVNANTPVNLPSSCNNPISR